MKIYSRDRRSPVPSSAIASKIMSAIKRKNTKPELMLRKLLTGVGIRGYRLHWKVPGKPDLVFVGKKIAIFVHGCYWHRCPKCNLPIPKSNIDFWANKLNKNVERDTSKKDMLEDLGWNVIIIWECDLKNHQQSVLDHIKQQLMNVDN